MIVATALALHKEGRTYVVGNDIDLLVLLTALHQEAKPDLYLLQPGIKGSADKYFDIGHIQTEFPWLKTSSFSIHSRVVSLRLLFTRKVKNGAGRRS